MIELYNDDCLVIMDKLIENGIKVDAIICDPPYGTTSCSWDSIIPFEDMWQRLKQIRKENTPIILFGTEPFSSFLRCSNIDEYKYDIYWQKERATNILQLKKRPGKVIENISVFYKNQCTYNPQMTIHEGKRVKNKIRDGKLGNLVDNGTKQPKEYIDTGFRYPLQIVNFQRDILTCNLHPTQKPLLLMEYLIKTFTNEEDLVLDFTMGSGTTGLACKNLNRNFIGIELNKEYFNIAYERINKNDV